MFGTAGAFWVAVGVVAIWALTGPLFNFSDTWQLVINTDTSAWRTITSILLHHFTIFFCATVLMSICKSASSTSWPLGVLRVGSTNDRCLTGGQIAQN